MHTPSPTAGHTTRQRSRPRRQGITWPQMMLYAAPVVLIALYGALWITLHAGGGRGSAHTLWQSLALAETVLALPRLRRVAMAWGPLPVRIREASQPVMRRTSG
jgi:uncharacterized membrane protein